MKRVLSRLFDMRQVSLKQTIIKNIWWLFSTSISSRIIKLILVFYAARILGPEGFGLFNYAFHLIGVYFVFSDFGISKLYVRESQKDDVPAMTLLTTMSTMKGCFWLATLGFLFFGRFFIHNPEVLSIFYVIVAAKFVMEFNKYFMAILRSRQEMHHEGISQFLETVVVTAGGVYMLMAYQSLFHFSLAYLIGACVAFCYLLVVTRVQISPNHVSLSCAKGLLRHSLPFFFSGLVASMLIISDTLMIQWIHGEAQVGYYQAAIRLVAVASILSGFVVNALFPVLSNLHEHTEKFVRVLKKGLSMLLMLSIPIMFGGCLIAKDLVVSIYTAAYLPSVSVFTIMLLSICMYSTLALLGQALLALNKQLTTMYISIGSIAANIVLNVILIPSYGIEGAAVASLLARSLNAGLVYYFCRRYTALSFLHVPSVMKYVSASLLMVAVLLMVPVHWHVALVIGIGACVYGVTLLVLKDRYAVELYQYLMAT